MTFITGTKLGAYEIIGLLGAGGMGEVYRALDTKLKRDVAIKALPQVFSRDPDRIARFQFEAEVLASLNHPNIASIYQLEDCDGSQFLVLELVEGEMLSERLARGPIPIDEVLRIATQVCEAVEAAHEKNVIHRDLKPTNIKLTPNGDVKLLDFGLARMFELEPTDFSSQTTSPLPMTQAEVVLGTAAYMSPEQARGKTVDKRTDIWAFGCVLFEMLTARQAFGGETAADVTAGILSGGPDLNALPLTTPPKIRDLIRKCLEKERRQRLHDIADARIEIAEVAASPAEIVPVLQAPPRRATGMLLALGALLAVLSFLGGIWLQNLRAPEVKTWSGTLLVGGSTVAWGPRVSPDGRTVAFIVMIDAKTQVGLMDAESGSWDVLTKRPESGVHIHAAWSRDGSKVYFTRGTTEGVNVYSIPSVGGEERLVLDNAYFPEPLSDGSLLVTRSNEAGESQLYRYWPEGNRVEPLPAFLASGLDPLVPIRAFADGKEAVFFGKAMTAKGLDLQPSLHIIDLSSKETRTLASDLGVNADVWPVSAGLKDFVLTDGPSGDLHRVVAIDRRGTAPPQVLLTLTDRFSGLDMAEDGTIFTDQNNNTLEVLKINPASGSLQPVARADTYLLKSHTIELPDGRVILPTLISGRSILMLTKTNKLATSLIDTSEETSGPISVVGNDRVAFLIGSGSEKSVALASLTDRRIIGRISVPDAASIVQLGSSPDGKALFYVSEKSVWAVPSDGGEPRKIASGADSMAVDPNGRELILQRVGPNLSVRLVRVSLSDGSEKEIKIGEDVRIGDVPLATNAVSPDGRILVTTALNANTWYWQVSVLDPRTGNAQHVPTDFAGDILYAGWTSEGQILAMGLNTEGSIWRFRPQAQ